MNPIIIYKLYGDFMNLSDLLTNQLTIGIIASVFGGALLTYGIPLIVRQIQSRFGVFSGQYIALTGDPRSGVILIESVQCHHVGNDLKGRIDGVTRLAVDRITYKTKGEIVNKGSYLFSGFVDGRSFVISYRTTVRGVQSSGVIALKTDSEGKIFTGKWAGFESNEIKSNLCIWIRIDSSISSKKQTETIVTKAEEYIASLSTVTSAGILKGYSSKSTSVNNIVGTSL